MSRLKMILAILFANNKPKDPVQQAKAIESVRVQALKRQVDTLNEINQAYAEQVKSMSKAISQQKEGDMQDKILSMAMDLFAPKQQPPLIIPTQSEPQTKLNLESGVQYSDSDLIEMAQKIPSPVIDQLKSASFEVFSNIIKSQIPNISQESLKRSREILEQMP